MKTITCKMMNLNKEGMGCDFPMTVSSYDELMQKGMEHMEQAHPEQAARIKSMPKNDPIMVGWEMQFKKIWEATPEI